MTGLVQAACLILSLASGALLFAGDASSEALPAVLDAGEVLRNFAAIEAGGQIESAGRTISTVRDYAELLQGRKLRGSGKTVGVLTNPRVARVTIISPGSSPAKGFNIVLVTTPTAASGLFKDDKLYFEGVIGNISERRGLSIDIEGSFSQTGP